MTLSGDVEDIRPQDFSFEIKPPRINVQKDMKDAVISRPDNIVVDLVELGVERRLSVKERFDFVPQKQLIIVTPTYNHAFQAYYLNRLGQVLQLVPPPLLWIVVEMDAVSVETADVVRKTGVMYRHLVCTTNSTSVKDRGVHQRNRALEHIERHKLDGVIYFADDGDLVLGLLPCLLKAKTRQQWKVRYVMKVSTILWNPKRWQRHTSYPIWQLDTVKEGFQETTFMEQVVEDEDQMERIPPGCSRIMNWHLHMESHEVVYPRGWMLQKNLDAVLPIK